MAIDPPYRLDPFQNIVNVRWGGQTRGNVAVFMYREGTLLAGCFVNGWNFDRCYDLDNTADAAAYADFRDTHHVSDGYWPVVVLYCPTDAAPAVEFPTLSGCEAMAGNSCLEDSSNLSSFYWQHTICYNKIHIGSGITGAFATAAITLNDTTA